MPSMLPEGDPAPDDGSLPISATEGLGTRPFGLYVHVPFCRTRCGYCDFNTYTSHELGPGADPGSYVDTALTELRRARRALGEVDLPVQTIFVGGGTPTLLPPGDLTRLVSATSDEFGLAPGAEVTTEANPESVDAGTLDALRGGGFTRISLGMQSAVPHVLRTLDRQHTPGRPELCVAWARTAGFEHISLDLIYGTPGESEVDWRTSLDAALDAHPDHVSAYALVVEAGTRLAGQVARGELAAPDDDVLADRYLVADDVLTSAGLGWYEVSNWALDDDARCRHNLGYWRGADWWGIGPGAHSHIGGTRWWNVKHPAAYAQRLAADRSPAHAREVLDADARHSERVLLEVRLVDGLPLHALPAVAVTAAGRLVADGLLARDPFDAGQAVLTLRGRLLTDTVVRALLP